MIPVLHGEPGFARAGHAFIQASEIFVEFVCFCAMNPVLLCDAVLLFPVLAGPYGHEWDFDGKTLIGKVYLGALIIKTLGHTKYSMHRLVRTPLGGPFVSAAPEYALFLCEMEIAPDAPDAEAE